MHSMVMTSEQPLQFFKAESEPMLEGALQNLKVLLVEDDLDNQQLLLFLLQPTGIDLHFANNGADAVERLCRKCAAPFDVILMDMQMPVMDGFEATAELRSRGVQTPIIALTAYTHATERDRCQQVGCTAFLAKPFASEELFQALAEIADPRSAVRACADKPPEFFELLQRYLGSLKNQLRALDTAESKGDVGELRRLAHRLRGVAGNYGFPRIAAIAGACEDALRNGDDSTLASTNLSQLKALMHAAVLTHNLMVPSSAASA